MIGEFRKADLETMTTRALEVMRKAGFGLDTSHSILDVARNCCTRQAREALNRHVLLLAMNWKNLSTDQARVCADAVSSYTEAFASRYGGREK